MYAVSKAMPLDATAEESKQQILDLVRDFTLETTPGSAAKIPDYRQHLRPGCRVAVTFLPGSDFADTVATAKRLQDEGFQPMPHFAARSIPSREALEDYLKALADVTELRPVVALAGAVHRPTGPFESSMAIPQQIGRPSCRERVGHTCRYRVSRYH